MNNFDMLKNKDYINNGNNNNDKQVLVLKLFTLRDLIQYSIVCTELDTLW